MQTEISGKLTGKQLDLTATLAALKETVDKILRGDLSVAEPMLYSQAISLNLLFAELSGRACERKLGSAMQTF